jgi:soluble lytic murein transglycosylase
LPKSSNNHVVVLPNKKDVGIMAAYHLARSVERRGQLSRAEALFVDVRQRDRAFPRFYAILSDLRLRTIRATIVASCERPDECVVRPDAIPEVRRPEGRQSVQWEPIDRPPTDQDLAMLAERIAPLLEKHEAAYPWLARAHDALVLGWRDVAADELFETLMAWRDAIGRKVPRAGLESVARAGDRDRHGADWRTKRARLALDLDARRALADVAEILGEQGTAVGFDVGRLSDRPQPYPAYVAEAARRHAIDPALLFAVMRVESVLQPRIVSYAGAVGLLQIMPRTGRMIARARGIDGFHPSDLLDPALNLDFAAWYLASLLDRFDGHLPLAIASYNGGPHHVRRWMAEHGSSMPLDAFLERIPFTQTHRYVRRVLSNYVAYRELEGRPMEPLSMVLPSIEAPDPVGF